jgi:hypothetical protein
MIDDSGIELCSIVVIIFENRTIKWKRKNAAAAPGWLSSPLCNP